MAWHNSEISKEIVHWVTLKAYCRVGYLSSDAKCFKPVSHQPCGSHAPVYERNLGIKTILRFARSQGCRNVVRRIFNMFIFLAIFGPCPMVARQPQGSLEVTARLTYEFARSEGWDAVNQSLRLSHEGRKVVARRTCGCLAFDPRQPQEYYEAYGNCKLSHSSYTTALRQP